MADEAKVPDWMWVEVSVLDWIVHFWSGSESGGGFVDCAVWKGKGGPLDGRDRWTRNPGRVTCPWCRFHKGGLT